jgi:hypothetical protein
VRPSEQEEGRKEERKKRMKTEREVTKQRKDEMKQQHSTGRIDGRERTERAEGETVPSSETWKSATLA